MNADEAKSAEAAELRHQAEARLGVDQPPEPPTSSPEDTRRLVHELQVHQIELQMQNEELRRAQAELEASRVRYFDFYDNIPVGYVTISQKGLILEANLAAAALLGIPRSALVKQPISRFILKEDADIHYLHRQRLLEDGQAQAYELRLVKDDRTAFWARLETTAAQDADGNPICRLVLSDITKRRKAEESLRESERFAHATLDALSAHLAILDERGTIVAVNRAWRAFALANAREVARLCQGADYLAVCDAAKGPGFKEAAAFAAGIRSMLQGKSDEFTLEYPCHSPSEQRWFIGRVTRFGGAGAPRLVVAHENITSRKQVEEALRQSEERLSLAQRSAGAGMWDWDLVTDQLNWSPELFRLFGLDAKLAPTPDLWRGRLHPEDRQTAETRIAQAIGDRTQLASEYRIIKPTGEIRWLVSLGDTTFDEHGKAIRMTGICIDITEHKRLEEQLLQSQKMEAIGRLAGGIAHDFRNQLAIVQGYGQRMLRRSMVTEEGKAALADILGATEKGAKLTAQLLAFSRNDMLQPCIVNVSELVTKMAASLSPLVGEDITISISGTEHDCPANLAANQFEQAMMNLAANARDAMPTGGRLTIEITPVELEEHSASISPDAKPGRYVRLTLSDTGSGMDQPTLDMLFEPYFTTKARGEGTGLGLAMVYGFVRQSGGFVTVHSRIGNGTTFGLYFPSAADTVTPAVPAADHSSGPGGQETILVAEDEQQLRLLLVGSLQEAGYTVLEAANAQTATDLAKAHPGRLDLLITDVVMPGLSGVDLAHNLRGTRPRIPVLFLSGYGGKALSQRGLDLDRAELISKPFQHDELMATIRRLLDTAHT